MKQACQVISEPREVIRVLKSGLAGRNVMVKYAGQLPPISVDIQASRALRDVAGLVHTLTAPSDELLITARYKDQRELANCSLSLRVRVLWSKKSSGFAVTCGWADEFVRLHTQLLKVFVDVNIVQSAHWLDVEFEFPVYKKRARIPHHRDLIMLVEDNAFVREATRSVLEFEGHRVIEFVSGEHAVEHLATYAQGLALLITDIALPGLSGLELLEKVRKSSHEVPVLLMSGYTDTFQPDGGNGLYFLAKPFTASQLTASIRRCFAGYGRLQKAVLPEATGVEVGPIASL